MIIYFVANKIFFRVKILLFRGKGLLLQDVFVPHLLSNLRVFVCSFLCRKIFAGMFCDISWRAEPSQSKEALVFSRLASSEVFWNILHLLLTNVITFLVCLYSIEV